MSLGGRESYAKALAAGQWEGFHCSLTNFSQDDFRDKLHESAREFLKIIHSIVRYDLDMGPGGAAVGKGELQMPVEGANNVGTQNTVVDPNCTACEGGRLSEALNQVWGINAVAGVHDVMQVSLGTGIARDVLNVPGMIPAATLTYTAALSRPLTHLDTGQIISIATTYSRNKERDRRHQLLYALGY